MADFAKHAILDVPVNRRFLRIMVDSNGVITLKTQDIQTAFNLRTFKEQIRAQGIPLVANIHADSDWCFLTIGPVIQAPEPQTDSAAPVKKDRKP